MRSTLLFAAAAALAVGAAAKEERARTVRELPDLMHALRAVARTADSVAPGKLLSATPAIDRLKRMFVALHQHVGSGVAAAMRKPGSHAPRKQPASMASSASTHSYFPANGTLMAFLPEFIGAAAVGSHPLSFSSPCFTSNYASVTSVPGANGTATLTLNVTSSSGGFLCSDFYLAATAEAVQLIEVTAAGTLTYKMPVSAARATWVAREGVRFFRFMHDPVTSALDLLATVGMFVPSLIEPTLDNASVATNLGFLRDYIGFEAEVRPVANSSVVTMDWDIVQSGDLMMVQRLDGLGVLEDWGTGAVTTHTVMPIRRPDGLYIFESTTLDAYWKLADGVQINPLDAWLANAGNASFNVVHIPLSAEIRARWNNTAAEAFIAEAVAGHWPYGYSNFIATFFDTPASLPWPASWQLIEVIFNLLESIDPAITNQLMADGLNLRLGTTGLDLTQIADAAAARNMTFAQLLSVPEEDSWIYPNGPNMVRLSSP